MDGSIGTYGGGAEKCTGTFCGNLREREHLKDVCVDGSMILKLILRM